jgi:hypothetical protein
MPDEPDPDALYAEARTLARCASRLPPGEMASRAQRFLTDCHARIAAAPRPTVLRNGYHRTAAAAALVGAAASVRAGDRTSQWATAAEEHARAAGDGPLLAELWLIRSVEDGAAAHAREIGSPAAMRHVLAAQSVAGASAFMRCWAHLVLANEWALDGEGHGALIELDCAAHDAEHALPSPFAAPVEDVGAWFSGSRGAVLRKLGRWAEAEAALQSAGSRGIVSDVYGAVEWARLRLATGDADAAAAHLTAALDTCHALGLGGQVPFIAAAARDLPHAASTRQLADLLGG